jgi:protein gp37
MGDLFHSDVPFEYIAAIFGVMAANPQHTFQVLTKRPKRAKDWFNWIYDSGRMVPFLVGEEIPEGASGEAAACVMSNTIDPALKPIEPKAFVVGIHQPWPLPNVCFGVTAENQETADERIPILMEIPAVVRFVSCEPLLGPIDMTRAMYGENPIGMNCFGFSDGLGHEAFIDWIIAGAETGSGARPMDPDWALDLRSQCKAADVPFFFKKMSKGMETPTELMARQLPKLENK